MKQWKGLPYLIGAVAALVFVAVCLYVFCPAINIQNAGLWFLVGMALLIFGATVHAYYVWNKVRDMAQRATRRGQRRLPVYIPPRIGLKCYAAPAVVFSVALLCGVVGVTMFNAKAYSEILTVTEADFSADLSESVGTDSIALMDTASAQMLGDREIGALSDVVSQFDVSYDYTQIDFGGKPIKVAPLEYAGFFKWMNNRADGVRGYVTVDPVSMLASFCKSEGMKYVPSAFFGQDAYRRLWKAYPTLMMENLHFEIDESGKPYYVASVVKKTVALFGGKTVSGCVVLDPVTGETAKYDAADIPQWIDVVFHGDLICEQYNWHGMFQNGYLNSLFAKKGCKQVTTYYSSAEEETDDMPISDYGYVAKDGDIWIYTGVTSVNGDSSNIGFLLANERTGESRYYAVAGADEKSAMAAAEGEVQEKGYQASFPSLINIDGHPTYIMVLKDSGGLVKLYATVNVQQYNIVTTAATQTECIQKYKEALGVDSSEDVETTQQATVTIAAIKYITIDGNTYIYLIDSENHIYKAKAAAHEAMLLLNEGDVVTITYTEDNTITACEKQ